MFQLPGIPIAYAYNPYEYNPYESSDDDDDDDLYNFQNSVYSPQEPLSSGEYGVFADYVTPLYNTIPEIPYPPFGVDPLLIPGAVILSDVVGYLEDEEVLRDDIEIFEDEKYQERFSNLPRMFDNQPPIKNLTRIIRYVKSYSTSDEQDSSEDSSEKKKKKDKPKNKKKHREHKKPKSNKSSETESKNHSSKSETDGKNSKTDESSKE